MARKTRIPKQCADKKESSAKRKSLGKRKSFAKKELQNSHNSHDDLWLLMTLFCDSHSMRSSLIQAVFLLLIRSLSVLCLRLKVILL